MSLDFHTKIQNLTNKLHSLTAPQKKEIDIEDVKSSLKKMLDEIGKELIRTSRRV
jgi:division protein CdvB (Snf7/Vps24/ESCRT-III family)